MTILNNSTLPDTQVPVSRLRYSPITKAHSRATETRTKSFLKGPVPMDWLSAAAHLPGKALNLALTIQWLTGMNAGKPVKLTAKALGLLNVSDDACSDGLKRLEGAGLIHVIRSPGMRPIVAIRPTAPPR